VVTFTCAGHRNLKASHHKTVEITSATEVSARATCIVGVGASLPVGELLALRGEVEVRLRSGDQEDGFTATVSPFYLGEADLVFRSGPALRQRTFAGHASKSAADLDPALVAVLQAGGELTVTVQETGRGERASALFVVAVPIGNIDDLTPRARLALAAADLVVAEDTRRYRSLAREADLAVPDLESHHLANERDRTPAVVERIRRGDRVALVSDAGTPAISDPGYLLVEACLEADLEVMPLPGASAVLTAVAASGLPASPFQFGGFLPRSSGERRRRLLELTRSGMTTVVFEAPHRIEASLRDIAEALHDPEVVVGRELTKIHEEFVRGRASELAAALSPGEGLGTGEHTIVIGPVELAQEAADVDDRLLAALAAGGVPTKVLADAVRAASGVARNEAYERVLRASRPPSP
jgi:16S rRNA (cytidine1402-2'-O)-methyltransferase